MGLRIDSNVLSPSMHKSGPAASTMACRSLGSCPSPNTWMRIFPAKIGHFSRIALTDGTTIRRGRRPLPQISRILAILTRFWTLLTLCSRSGSARETVTSFVKFLNIANMGQPSYSIICIFDLESIWNICNYKRSFPFSH